MAETNLKSLSQVIQDEVLNSVGTGQWVFNRLVPPFRISLGQRLNERFQIPFESIRSFSLMKMTALAYGEMQNPQVLDFAGRARLISPASAPDDARSVISHLVGKIYHGSSPIEFSEDDASLIHEAEQVIHRTAPTTGSNVAEYLKNFVKVRAVPYRSASYPRAQGCIFLGERAFAMTASGLAVSLVHEMAHQELFLINLLDRLVNASADYHLAHAPFQGKLRPPIGRLHSFYALFRMVQLGRELGLDVSKNESLFTATAASFTEGEITSFANHLLARCANHLFPSRILKLNA